VFGLPNPYVIGAVAVLLLGSHTAVWLKATSAANGRWEAVRATERADAMRVQLDAEKRAREAENRAAKAAITIEAEHARNLADIDAATADFNRRLRALPRPGRCDGVPSAPGPAGNPADPATGSGSRPGGNDIASVTRLRRTALKLQADVKACWAWAATTQKEIP